MRRMQRRFAGWSVLLAAVCLSGCDDAPTTPSPPPIVLSQVSLAPAILVAGETGEGTVTLSGPAPAGGTAVRLSSSDGVAIVPAAATVPSGSVSASFPVRTRLVAADTAATISAAIESTTREAVLRVTAPIPRPPALQALEIVPAAIKGGQTAQGTVRLTGPALAPGVVVTLESSNAAAIVPRSVTVEPGASAATFPIATTTVGLDTIFDITATFSGQIRAVPIRLTP